MMVKQLDTENHTMTYSILFVASSKEQLADRGYVLDQGEYDAKWIRLIRSVFTGKFKLACSY